MSNPNFKHLQTQVSAEQYMHGVTTDEQNMLATPSPCPPLFHLRNKRDLH